MKIIKLSQFTYPMPTERKQRTPKDNSNIPPISMPDFDLYNVEGGKVNVTIDRYPNSRFWQISVNGNLLAVVVYRKGAEAIKSLIEKLSK